jgi:asparagine synthase (glutamine-hydrolysing)
MSPSRIVGRALVVAGSSPVDAYRSLMEPLRGGDGARRGDDEEDFAREQTVFRAFADPTLAAQASDLTTYLPSCLTTKVDIATMAHSLEARAPFLDHRLIELGLALPREERIGWRATKVLLRRIASERLGDAVATRPKRGFGLPLEVWLRGPMQPAMRDHLLGPAARLHALVERRVVEGDVAAYEAGNRALHTRVWTLVALESWLRGPLGRRAVP